MSDADETKVDPTTEPGQADVAPGADDGQVEQGEGEEKQTPEGGETTPETEGTEEVKEGEIPIDALDQLLQEAGIDSLEKLQERLKQSDHAQQKITEQGQALSQTRSELAFAKSRLEQMDARFQAAIPGAAEPLPVGDEYLERLADPAFMAAEIARGVSVESAKIRQEMEEREFIRETMPLIDKMAEALFLEKHPNANRELESEVSAMLNDKATAVGYIANNINIDFIRKNNNNPESAGFLKAQLLEEAYFSALGRKSTKIITDHNLKAKRDAKISVLKKTGASALRGSASTKSPTAGSDDNRQFLSDLRGITVNS